MGKTKLPVSFKFAILLFFLSLQCFLGAFFIKEMSSFHKLEAALATKPVPVLTEAIGQDTTFISAGHTGIKAHASAPKPVKRKPLTASRPARSDRQVSAKKGTLWFDRQNDSYVITLGKRNGLEDGDTVSIYDSGRSIGKAKIIQLMEKLSLVKIGESDLKKLTKTYYKIELD